MKDQESIYQRQTECEKVEKNLSVSPRPKEELLEATDRSANQSTPKDKDNFDIFKSDFAFKTKANNTTDWKQIKKNVSTVIDDIYKYSIKSELLNTCNKHK